MKILANVSINFSATGISATAFSISYNWITETGIFAGNTNVSVPFYSNPPGPGPAPAPAVSVTALNQAIINAITTGINASGKYSLQTNDEVVLMGGFTNMYMIPHAH